MKNIGYYICLIGIYTAVHIFLLLNKSIFWDDWIWYLNPEQYKLALSEIGIVSLKALFSKIIQFSIFEIKLLVFFCFLCSGFFLFESLKLVKILDRSTAFWATALFLILPYNILGRSVVVSTLIYSVSFMLFLLAVWLYIKFRSSDVAKSSRFIFLMVSLLAFTLSFNTTSMLPIYVAVIVAVEIVFTINFSKEEKKKAVLRAGGLALLHAVIFFAVKVIFFKPNGEYADYNNVDISSSTFTVWLTEGIALAMLEPLVFSFFGKAVSSYPSANVRYIQAVLIWLPVLFAYKFKKPKSMYLALAGIALALMALFPYLAVAKKPDSYEWDSRHLLLIPLGTCLWLVSILMWFESKRIQKCLAIIMILGFSFGSIRLYLSVQGFRYQDLSLTSALERYVDANNQAVYLVEGQTSPGVSDRLWRGYELQGLMYKSTNTQNNLLIPKVEWGNFKKGEFGLNYTKYKERTMVGNIKWAEPFYCLNISELQPMTERKIASLMFDEFFSKTDLLTKRLEDFYDYKKKKLNLQTQECLEEL